MSSPSDPSMKPEPVRCHCPVCGAIQLWSSQCRRCRTDLGWLYNVAVQVARIHDECKEAVHAHQWERAKELAKELMKLSPSNFYQALYEFTSEQCDSPTAPDSKQENYSREDFQA